MLSLFFYSLLFFYYVMLIIIIIPYLAFFNLFSYILFNVAVLFILYDDDVCQNNYSVRYAVY